MTGWEKVNQFFLMAKVQGSKVKGSSPILATQKFPTSNTANNILYARTASKYYPVIWMYNTFLILLVGYSKISGTLLDNLLFFLHRVVFSILSYILDHNMNIRHMHIWHFWNTTSGISSVCWRPYILVMLSLRQQSGDLYMSIQTRKGMWIWFMVF